MSEPLDLEGRDVPIDKLLPLNERNINLKNNRGFRKIVATIKAIGLIEPLCVYEEEGRYVILDGFLRYKACQELGVASVPCLVSRTKEAYTYNRMVNRLSQFQASRMLHQSLGTLDEKTIAKVFGIKYLRYRLATTILKSLHDDVAKAVDENRLSRRCATEMTYVKRERQVEILAAMDRHKDYSISFARALIVKTPARQRNHDKKRMRPWTGPTEKKNVLVSKLEEIQKRYDFYANLYRQYSADLLKLCIYVRTLVTNERVRTYLEDKHPQIRACFEHIVFEVGKASAA